MEKHKTFDFNTEPTTKKVPKTTWTMEEPQKQLGLCHKIKYKVNKACEDFIDVGETRRKHLSKPAINKTGYASTKTNLSKNYVDGKMKRCVKINNFADLHPKPAKENSDVNEKRIAVRVDSGKAKRTDSIKLQAINAGRIQFSKDCETTYKLPHKVEASSISKKENVQEKQVPLTEPINIEQKQDIVWKRKTKVLQDPNYHRKELPDSNYHRKELPHRIIHPSQKSGDKRHEFNQTVAKKPDISVKPIDRTLLDENSGKPIPSSENLIREITHELNKCKIMTDTRSKTALSTSSDTTSSYTRPFAQKRMQHLDRMASNLCNMVNDGENYVRTTNKGLLRAAGSAKSLGLLDVSMPIETVVQKMKSILDDNKAELKQDGGHSKKNDRLINRNNCAIDKPSREVQVSSPNSEDSFIQRAVDQLPIYYSRQEIKAAVKIQSAYRGYKVRKITKELLRSRKNHGVKSVGYFYRSSQVGPCGSLEIRESCCRWNESKVPNYLKPIVSLAENINVNDFLKSSFSLGKTGLTSQDKPKALMKRPPTSSLNHKYEIELSEKPSPVKTFDLLAFEAKKIDTPVDTSYQSREASKFMHSKTERNYQELCSISTIASPSSDKKGIDLISVENSSVKNDLSFVPHKAKCLAPADLSNRINAELLYQDTVSLALGHIKELEHINSALNMERNFPPLEPFANNYLSNVFDRDVNTHKTSTHGGPNIPQDTRAENELKATFFPPSVNVMQHFSEKAFSAGEKLLNGQFTDIQRELTQHQLSYDSDQLEHESLTTSNLSVSIPAEDSSDPPTTPPALVNKQPYSNPLYSKYTVELVPSAGEETDSVVDKCAKTEIPVWRTFPNIDSQSETKITSHNESLQYETVNDFSLTSSPNEQMVELSYIDNYAHNSSLSNTVELVDNHFSKGAPLNSTDALESTLKVVRSMQNEENLRTDHQMTLLKLQEHSLIREAKANLKKIETNGGPNVRCRQRAVWHQLKVQLSHIKCLIETQTVAAEQKRLMYWQYLQLLASSVNLKNNKSPSVDVHKTSLRADTPFPRQHGTSRQRVQPDTENSLDSTSHHVDNVAMTDPDINDDAKAPPQRQTSSVDGCLFMKEIPPSECPNSNGCSVKSPNFLQERKKFCEQNAKDSVSLISSPRQVVTHPENRRILEPSHGDSNNQDSNKKNAADNKQRRRLTSALRLSLSPAFSHTRRYSSESDDSFTTLSQNETASDVSDGERRLSTLKSELSAVKTEADRLFREKKRLRRERTASQELSLQKQIAAYNEYILRTRQEVEEEMRHGDSVGVKPLIKKRYMNKEPSSDQSFEPFHPLQQEATKPQVVEQNHNSSLEKMPIEFRSQKRLQVHSINYEKYPSGIKPREISGDYVFPSENNDAPQKFTSFPQKISPESQIACDSRHLHTEEQPAVEIKSVDENDRASVIQVAPQLVMPAASLNEVATTTTQEVTTVVLRPEETVSRSNDKLKKTADRITIYLYDSLLTACVQNIIDIFDRKRNAASERQPLVEFDTKPKLTLNHCPSSGNVIESKNADQENFDRYEFLDEPRSPEATGSDPDRCFNPEELSCRLSKMNLWNDDEPSKGIAAQDDDFNISGHEGSWFDAPFWASTETALPKDQDTEAAYLELQKLRELFPDLVLREVPNKPPPPYTPPKTPNSSPIPDKVVSDFEVPFVDRPHRPNIYRQSRAFGNLDPKLESVIPSDPKVVDNMVRSVVEHIHPLRMLGHSFGDIQFDPEVLIDFSGQTDKDDGVRTFQHLLFDLCKNYLKEALEESKPEPVKLTNCLSEQVSYKVRQCFNQQCNLRNNESSLTQWAKTKQDKVGRVIIEGILAEEHNWVNVCEPNIARHVKNQISDNIFASILDETVNSFEKILAQKQHRNTVLPL